MLIFPVFDAGDYSNDNNNFFIKLLLNTPLRLILTGHESVILFFILSGFVLSLPYYTSKEINYHKYLIKRFFRIYIPYLIAVIIAILANLLFSQNGILTFSDWFNKIWTYKTSLVDIVNHILFLGYYNTNEYNTVIWSLVHEMRISIIFPFLMFLILRFSWKTNITIVFVLSIASFMLLKIFEPKYNTNFIITLHYISMFMIGSLLAKHKEFLVGFYNKANQLQRFIFFLFALTLYTYQGLLSHIKLMHNFLINEYLIAMGSSLFIIIALSTSKFSVFLNLKPLRFLGEISYSLYLYHTIILFSLIYIFKDTLPIYIILFSTVICSIIWATIFYYFVEKPSKELGTKLINKRYKKNG